MIQKLKRILIDLLFRLVDVPTSQIDDEGVQLWLAQNWEHPASRRYLQNRIQTIKDALAGGLGMTELPRDGYVRQIGQRLEVLFFSHKCKTAFEKLSKERKEKIE